MTARTMQQSLREIDLKQIAARGRTRRLWQQLLEILQKKISGPVRRPARLKLWCESTGCKWSRSNRQSSADYREPVIQPRGDSENFACGDRPVLACSALSRPAWLIIQLCPRA